MPAEVKRTCRKCGTVWYVTEKQAREKAPSDAQLAAVRLQALGSLGRAGGQLGGLEAQRARIDALNHCSQCGSADFSGEFIPDESKQKVPRDKASHAKDKERVRQIKQYIAEQKSRGRKVSWLDANLELNALDEANAIAALDRAGLPTEAGVRLCPFCAEEVKSAAIKCKHCGSNIDPARSAPQQES